MRDVMETGPRMRPKTIHHCSAVLEPCVGLHAALNRQVKRLHMSEKFLINKQTELPTPSGIASH